MAGMGYFSLTKEQAAAMFGESLAAAFGISRQAVNAWPDPLPERRANEVLGLALRRYGDGRLTDYGQRVVDGLLVVRGPGG
jgi:hypothetical protein